MEPFNMLDITIKICTLITVVSAVINIFVSLNNHRKAPEVEQNERIARLEERIGAVESSAEQMDDKFNALEQGNQVVLRSLLALLAHAIDGNNIDVLKQAKKELSNYLISK